MPVMIRVRARRYARWSRAPIDLVLVLDVASSRLEQVKQGAMFVVHNLETEDRLSILQSFQTHTNLIFPLTHMSDQQETIAKNKIKNLSAIDYAHSTIEFVPVMETAYQILDDCEDDKHRARSIMLLTDGLFENKSLSSTRLSSGDYPTYTIGIGSDHDPRILYDLARSGQYGTYSWVDGQDSKGISNAMALCIGGLTSIVARDVTISIKAVQEDVKISRIVSGSYDHVLDGGKISGSITVNDLYGLEEKNFLVYVKIPMAQGMLRRTTKLLTVKADYYCHVTKADVKTDQVMVSVKRPIKVRGQQIRNIFPQVTTEVIRDNVLERIREISIQSQNEVQGLEIIRDKLKSIQDYIGDTEDTVEDGKDKCDELSMDLDDMEGDAGVAYMLSWLSSHQLQRAAMTPGSSSTTSFSFRTTRMHNMIDSVESAPV
uniref:Uncharacterized protein n=1 Tax=Avena sativa TaxID=4498 RepID=A0ACD5V8W6_AVESA